MHENCKIKIGFICLLISLKGLGLMFLVPIIEINHEGIRSKIERLGVLKLGKVAKPSPFSFLSPCTFSHFWRIFALKGGKLPP